VLNVHSLFGCEEDSPCQGCIIKMLCNEPFGCSELSKYIGNKFIIQEPEVRFQLDLPKEILRSESWLTKLKVRVKTALSK